jgi:hypothetical protein
MNVGRKLWAGGGFLDAKLTHLQLIQGIVNRLAQSSFLLKGWSVVLVAALFAFAAKDSRMIFAYLAYFPAVAFWGLDAFCLWQERLYRALYNDVRTLDANVIDFSMNTSGYKKTVKWLPTMFSRTLLWFHGVLVLTIAAVMLLMSGGR